MPIQASINFVKDRLVSGLSLTKPALDLLAERLDEAARFNAVGGNPSHEKPKKRVSMPALIHRHGRIETAMMCVVVENVASAFLVHDHGVRGAIDRTLPLLSTRAMSTFDTAYDFLIGQAHTLVEAAAQSLDERVSPSLKAPAGVVVAGVDRSLRIALGEDYVVSARAYVAAVPERASTFARVKAAEVKAIKDNSRLASLLVSGVVHSSALSIFGAASFFAFTHVLTIRVEEEEEDVEGARHLALLACDLSTTTTATSTTAEDVDISDDNTLDFLPEDVVGDGKVEEVAEEVEVVEAVEDGEEEAMEDLDVEDVEEKWVWDGLETIAEDVMETDTGVDDDDEITIIPSWLIEEGVVKEVAHIAGVDAEGYADAEEEEDDIFDFEPTLSVIEEVDEEDEIEGVEDVDVKAALSVAEWLDEVEDVEGGFDDEEEDFCAVCGVEDDSIVSEHAALETFDDGMLLELAIMEQYQGGGEEDGEEDGLVSVAVLSALEEEEDEEVSAAELLLELAIMEQYQQGKEDEELAELEEHLVEETREDLEDHQEEALVQVVEEAKAVVEARQDWADEVEAFLLSAGGEVEVKSAVNCEHGDETEFVVDVSPEEPKGECTTVYNELRWAGESMAAYILAPIVKEDLQEVGEAVALSGPIHQPVRCASMPCLSSWRSVTEGQSLGRSASFEFLARKSHFEDVEDVLAEEPVAEVAPPENQEVCEKKEETVEDTGLDQPSVAVNLVQEETDVRRVGENTPSILTSGSSSSRSTLTALASPFVPRGNLKLSAPGSTSAREDSEKENGFTFQLPPPAHWTPAKGVSVTISAPRPTPPPVKVKKGPSRKERHIARMGIKKEKGKGKEKDKSSVLSERDLNTK